jgi:leucyl-tRNA synthetase
LDSAWYYLGYLILGNQKLKIKNKKFNFDKSIIKKWLPVNMYIGGPEHAVLHLLYSRFLTMVFYDLGLLQFEEPFTKFRAHGLLIREGAKMSKSRGNILNPDDYIKKFGADVFRMYLMFLAPFEQGGNFRDAGILGIKRFLDRVWKLIQNSKFKIQNYNSKFKI